MFHDFKFSLGIFTTHLTFIYHKCLFHIENYITGLTTAQGNSVIVIFNVEKKFKEYVCQICGKYAKTTSEIVKQYLKKKTYTSCSKLQILGFQNFVRKGKPNHD